MILFLIFFLYPAHNNNDGRIIKSEFSDDFDVYIKEEIALNGSLGDYLYVWKVNDNQLKNDMLEILLSVEPYRPRDSRYDPMFPVELPDRYYYPAICLDAEEYGYYLEIINWNNFIASQGSTKSHIVVEKKDSYMLVMHKKNMNEIVLSEYPNSRYEYIASGRFDAFELQQGEKEWYVELSEESMNTLISLARSVSDQNADIYKKIALTDYYNVP